jgi:hypothetical protein
MALCGVLLAATALAEQRLPDVAASIRLQRPDGERLVVVEPGPGKPGGRVEVSGTDVVEMTETLLARGRVAADLLQQTRSSLVFFDDGWRRRMLDAFSDVDTARIDLELCQPPSRYRDAVDDVTMAAREYQVAAGIVRWAILRDQALLGGAYRHMEAGERGLRGALAELRTSAGQERIESAPPSTELFASGGDARAVCREQYGTDSGPALDHCIERQEASLDAMRRRFSFSVGLDGATFNAIRHACGQEWGGDMVDRDRCEQQRMAAARP